MYGSNMIMVVLDGHNDFRACEGKQVFSEIDFKFVTSLALNK